MTTSSSSKPVLTLTAGCGGAGKSTVMARMFPGLPVVDMDVIKEQLPGYDPLHPELVHEQSAVLAMREFYSRLGDGRDVVAVFALDSRAVVTLWPNRSTDRHATLDRSLYARP